MTGRIFCEWRKDKARQTAGQIDPICFGLFLRIVGISITRPFVDVVDHGNLAWG